VSERISRWALATQYGFERDIQWLPPTIKEMKIEDGKIILHMDASVGAVNSGAMLGFAIAGKGRRFHPAEAQWFVKGKDA